MFCSDQFFLQSLKVFCVLWFSWQSLFSSDLQELDAKVKSLMELSENRASNGRQPYVCKVCGKEGQWVAIRDHIEVKHLEGVTLPCNTCGKTFRSRAILRKHNCRNEWIKKLRTESVVILSHRSRNWLRRHHCTFWIFLWYEYLTCFVYRTRFSLRQHGVRCKN